MPAPSPLGTFTSPANAASSTPTSTPTVLNMNSLQGATANPTNTPAQPLQASSGLNMNSLPPPQSAAPSSQPASGASPLAPAGSPESQVSGFGSAMKSDTEGHAANIVEDLSQKPSFTGATDVLGNVAGETGDIIGGLTKLGAQATMPAPVYSFVSKMLKSGASAVIGSKPAEDLSDEWNKLSAQYPDATKNIANLLGISAIAVGADEGPTVGETANAVKTGASTAADMVSDAASKVSGLGTNEPSVEDIYEEVKPKMTPTEEASAKAAGRGSTVKGKVVIQPSDRDLEMAGYAKDAGVTPDQPYNEQIQTMKDAQKASATKVRSALQESDGTWSRTNVTKVLNDVDMPLTIKADSQLTRLAKAFKSAILQMTPSVDKNAEGILDLRQNVDDLIDKEFPKSIYTKDTPIGQYVRNVRQALNQFAESKIPEGTFGDGSTMSGELRRQSLLYDAIQNVADNAPKEGAPTETSFLGKAARFAKKHPLITAGAAYTADKAAKGLGIPGSQFLP